MERALSAGRGGHGDDLSTISTYTWCQAGGFIKLHTRGIIPPSIIFHPGQCMSILCHVIDRSNILNSAGFSDQRTLVGAVGCVGPCTVYEITERYVLIVVKRPR